MKNIHSKYLERDFLVAEISAEALEDIIINEVKASCKYKIKEIDDHPVVICTIEKDDRCVQGIGEGNEDMERPTIFASKEALVDAAKKFLNFEETNNARIDYNEDAEDDISYSAAPIKAVEEVAESNATEIEKDTTDDTVENSEPVEDIVPVENVTPEEPVIEEKAAKEEIIEEAIVENVPVVEETPPVEDVIITIGKYKGADKKASEVVAEDKQNLKNGFYDGGKTPWVKYIIDNVKPEGVYKKQIPALKYYWEKE